ncbi:hypothetical protein WHI96_20030 [Pseudonocardia tropica]|uniref:Uncharacterized protein n=1 Tax=Pseudonocardia tropica TaxID=681289 RepID=A0ABV1JYQ1_9PSEU
MCAEIIEGKCSIDADHRRCQPETCEWAADWHEPVREAGQRAAADAGAVWAVVSTLGGVRVVGTTDHLGRAKSLLRTPEAKRHGITGAAAKGVVYIVRGSDGGFF